MLVAVIGDRKSLISYQVCLPSFTCVTSLICVMFSSDYQPPVDRNSRNQNVLSTGHSRDDSSAVRHVE